ncbi:MAG: PEP-CTERM sorting domain-containing protein [Luteolibacter sp.]
MKYTVALLSGLLFLAAGTLNSEAAVMITAIESGGDVVFTGSGTLNLGVLPYDGSVNAASGISPSINGRLVRVGTAVGNPTVDLWGGVGGFITAPSTGFGSGGFQSPDSTTGDQFGVGINHLTPYAGYVSGTFLSGSMTYSGDTFATLGINMGTYVWTWGSGGDADSLTLNIVPEPSSALLSLVGIAAIGLRRRRN